MPDSGPDVAVGDRQLVELLRSAAAQAGFDRCGITHASRPDTLEYLHRWLDAGHAGQMQYLERRRDAYADPKRVLGSVQSIIVLATSYATQSPPRIAAGQGRVSRYAWGPEDYHDLLRSRMRSVTEVLHQQRPGARSRSVVDTAPLLERDLARRAGLGWFGKNTMLIDRRLGSWFFLSAILTDVALPADEPHETSHCGTCTRCLDDCPTDAFVGPWQLDARRCISYLTIELRDQPVPLSLRQELGEWLFGCDICQDVCPWNRKAQRSCDAAFEPEEELNPVDLIGLLELSEEQFQDRFGRTPLARPGRSGLLRNACLVLGVQRHKPAVPALIRVLHDADALLRGAAAWALGRIGTAAVYDALQSRLKSEEQPAVREELEQALRSVERAVTRGD